METLESSCNSCRIVGLCVETLYSKIEVSLLGSSVSSSLEILCCRIVHSGCLEVCRKLLDLICMFSLLKRCKYSLYSDTMLNIGSITHVEMHWICVVLVLNETNTDVHMYIEEFILIDIWIHCCTWMKWFGMEITVAYIYKHNNRRERMRLLSDVQLTHRIE